MSLIIPENGPSDVIDVTIAKLYFILCVFIHVMPAEDINCVFYKFAFLYYYDGFDIFISMLLEKLAYVYTLYWFDSVRTFVIVNTIVNESIMLKYNCEIQTC